MRSITRTDGSYVAELDDRRDEADQVVGATGPFQVPFVPPIAERVDPQVVQLHSSAYRAPQDLPEGPVLVIGGGNTGFQIAEELSGSRVVHQRGVTESPGLHFLGLSWLHTRGSALIGWVKDDAEHIAHEIARFQPAVPNEARQPDHLA